MEIPTWISNIVIFSRSPLLSSLRQHEPTKSATIASRTCGFYDRLTSLHSRRIRGLAARDANVRRSIDYRV